MEAAGRVAARYRRDPQLRRLCQTAVPVAGLLAFGSSQITEDDYRALGRLAEAPAELADELLLSTDRFAVETAAADLTVEQRRLLLARLGLYGVRVARELLQTGRAPTSEALALELRRRSGVDELRALLTTQFAARAHLLKARVALSVLDRLTRRFPLADDGAFVADLERVEADTHELAELRLLLSMRTGGVALHDDEVVEIERLVERAGARATERIGLGDGATDDDVRAEIGTRVERWRRRAEHPLAERSTVDAATVVLRSYEGMRFELGATRGN